MKIIFEVLDATSKPQSGILFGNIMHVGNFDECLKIEKFVNGDRILGKYCQVQYNANFNYTQILSRKLNDEVIFLHIQSKAYLLKHIFVHL